ncbi:hypothetical protein Taro_031571, partial [Colocasia esculenta]|nr:hypothetical protein [Colocasia esculenta]
MGLRARLTPYSFQVRESRRLPNRLLVPGRTVAEQGLRHLQQCNFLSLYTSGYAPGSVVQVWWFGWSPQFLSGLVERQLDLLSVAARLRGRPVCLSGMVAG